ncbi:hypothetical protein PT279_08410 [Bifidobacterium sp. ESL0784]|uniref:hypothetical protein n=1 Tax=Bifidobacterium sp. ESL0784 TaxID=2983231 RepID=UPI0023F94DF7|nr:hypothetical protein [Bifidobacterium sp. ESL0784]MDF7641607.1 hypothetical protein [Bifidobacterium sp. ESL0784]
MGTQDEDTSRDSNEEKQLQFKNRIREFLNTIIQSPWGSITKTRLESLIVDFLFDLWNLGFPLQEEGVVDNSASETVPEYFGAVRAFYKKIRETPWGTASKTQLESLIFNLLIDAKVIEGQGKEENDFNRANALGTTPTRIQSLWYKYYQLHEKNDLNIATILLSSDISISESVEKDKYDLQINNRFFLEYVKNWLRGKEQMVTQKSLTPVLTVGPIGLVEMFKDLAGTKNEDLDKEGLKRLQEILSYISESEHNKNVEKDNQEHEEKIQTLLNQIPDAEKTLTAMHVPGAAILGGIAQGSLKMLKSHYQDKSNSDQDKSNSDI